MSKEEPLEMIARALAQQNCILNGIYQVMALSATQEHPAIGEHIIDLMQKTKKVMEQIRDQ